MLRALPWQIFILDYKGRLFISCPSRVRFSPNCWWSKGRSRVGGAQGSINSSFTSENSKIFISFYSIGTPSLQKGYLPGALWKSISMIRPSSTSPTTIWSCDICSEVRKKLVEGSIQTIWLLWIWAKSCVIRLVLLFLFLKTLLASLPISNRKSEMILGTDSETSALRCRQCRLYTRGHFG